MVLKPGGFNVGMRLREDRMTLASVHGLGPLPLYPPSNNFGSTARLAPKDVSGEEDFTFGRKANKYQWHL